MPLYLLRLKLNHFKVLNLLTINFEPYRCFHFMKTLFAGSSGIDVQEIEIFIVFHFQDV